MAPAGYWNHNVHYQSVILGAVPAGCGPALDVGCGDGMLAGCLAERCAEVTGIDPDRRMIAMARSQVGDHTRVRFIEADFLAHDFPPASFDFVCANTSLHHMDFAAALTAMARVSGGEAARGGGARGGQIVRRLPGERVRDPAQPGLPSPVPRGQLGRADQEPRMTWAEVRTAARGLLPGVRYRRHLLWRYSLLWRKSPE